jgi:hypothetical protein
MKIVVRPQFYLDIEEEVYWLLTNAGVDVVHCEIRVHPWLNCVFQVDKCIIFDTLLYR